MLNSAGLRANLGDLWIPTIYLKEVRSNRTRVVIMGIPDRENTTDIFHTLLGVELKVGKVRIACPDLASARYLRVFSRLGCREIAMPYDITKIAQISDKLETAWQRLNLILEGSTTRTRNGVIRQIRRELEAIGPGEAVPQFRQDTKQYRD